MSSSTSRTQLRRLTNFVHLELYKSENVWHHYRRHSHPAYTIGVIDQGVGGNSCRGSTHLSPVDSLVVMNPDEAHTGYAVGNVCSYRMFYVSERDLTSLSLTHLPHFRENVIHGNAWARRLRALHDAMSRSLDPLECTSEFFKVMSAFLAWCGGAAIESPRGREHRLRQVVSG